MANIGRLAGPQSSIDLKALFYRHVTLQGVSFSFSRDWETTPIREALRTDVLPAIARGDIRPVVDLTLNIADLRQAAHRLRSGQAIGKIVLTFDQVRGPVSVGKPVGFDHSFKAVSTPRSGRRPTTAQTNDQRLTPPNTADHSARS